MESQELSDESPAQESKQKSRKEYHRLEATSLASVMLFCKMVVFGIVAAGLFVAWSIEYLKPILQKENELSRIENEIVRYRFERQFQINEEISRQLKTSRDSLGVVIFYANSLRTQYENQLFDLEHSRQELSNQYDQLAEDLRLSEVQRKKYAQLAINTRRESDSLLAALVDRREPNTRSIGVTKENVAYGFDTSGVFFISESVIEETKGAPPSLLCPLYYYSVNRDSCIGSWEMLKMDYADGYYYYKFPMNDRSRSLNNGYTTYCFWIGGARYIPHELIGDSDYYNPKDIVDNLLGSYNFRTQPVQNLPFKLP